MTRNKSSHFIHLLFLPSVLSLVILTEMVILMEIVILNVTARPSSVLVSLSVIVTCF